MINNIKNNAISKADAKKKINEIKKAEIKNKCLNLAKKIDDLLGAIFNNNKNEIKNNNVREGENENENKNENDNENENENENESESESDNNDCEKYWDHKIKQTYNYFKEITKWFEEQIELLKKRDYIGEYWHEGYYHDNKELNLKILWKYSFE